LVELTVSPGALVFLLVLLVGIACIVVAGGVGLFGAQLATRPILSDIEDRLDPHPTPHAGASVRLRLLVAVPAFTVMTAGGGVLIGAAPGTDHGTLLLGLAIAVAASVVIAVPVTMLLAHSLLHPLDEIVAATERLQKGDFTKTVPELAADEYGKLARSLNDAMKGLAERQQLSAENEKLLADVRASRARIVAASDAERRRVERNIHDGAQQRLVALALDLRMIEDLAATEHSGELESRVRAAGENLRDALEELRELAQGLHPSVLSTDGLAPALAQLAAVAPLAVSLDVPEQRFAEEIESTLYFVASEALANVAKYARASRAEVTVEAQGRQVAIEIVDDGVGGADPGSGSGLAGLDDRVAALGGHVAVESPPGQGNSRDRQAPASTARVIVSTLPHMPVRVLIVDDHPVFRSRARALVETAGYDVVGEASDASSAIAEVHRLAPDVVLLDVQLPDRDGFSVAKELASDPDAPKVVLISSRKAIDYGTQLAQSPSCGFIHKPQLSRSSLLQLVGAPS
jgi:signal transduction histidine kinase/CheY-like chemotaxis protein